jgi:hypothetical protein
MNNNKLKVLILLLLLISDVLVIFYSLDKSVNKYIISVCYIFIPILIFLITKVKPSK